MAEWQPIETFQAPEREEVDVWMNIYASPRSMGWADAFRIPNAYRVKGKWFHLHEGKETELFADYITHWMPLPEPPK